MRDLSRDAWLRSTDQARRALAESLARELPAGFRFAAMIEHAGGRPYPVATFARAGRTFALVPGGRSTIGWSSDGWVPNADELASFASSADEYGLELPLQGYVAATRPRKEIEIAPMLVETVSSEVGWIPVEHVNDDVREAMAHVTNRAGAYTSTIQRGDAVVRVRKAEDGTVDVFEATADPTHSVLAGAFAEEGFRLATSDEWEHLCGGGRATLFRWGDHVRCDRYPTDLSPEEAAWRRRWALSGGNLARPPEGFRPDWNLHREPNGFALHIAENPYHTELVAEPGVTRGGDGGTSVCGGAGFFLGWLPLATAYFEDHACRRDPEETYVIGHAVGRRVLSLA